MTEKLSSGGSSENLRKSYAGVDPDAVFYVVLAAVLFLSYGYEIFNFNLTIDEEVHALDSGKWRDWVAQGRWGMALLNYALLPHPITPVVSTFLGVIGTALGVMFFVKDGFNLSRQGVLVATALAITTPTFAFTLTFSTLAYGVGCAFLAMAISNSLIYRRTLLGVVLASMLAAFAISVYQTFVFVLVMFVVVHVWRAHAEYGFANNVIYRYLAFYAVGSLLIYFGINFLVLKAASLDIAYVGQFVDLGGFIQGPIEKIFVSADRVFHVLSLHPGLFGIHSVWLGIVLFLSIVFSFAYPLINRDYYKTLGIVAVLVATFAIIVLADAIAQGGAPLRSVIYMPVAVAVVVSVGFAVAGDVGKRVLVILCFLAVVGNSMVSNHLFASSASAEFRDKMLAEAIIGEVLRLAPEKAGNAVLKIELVGNRMWPVTGVQSKTETFGASFFEWDGGNRHRVAAYLNLNGIAASGATEEERVRAYVEQKSMPIWPHAGWMALSGDVLILKFGEYSMPQKASLCAQGVAEICN